MTQTTQRGSIKKRSQHGDKAEASAEVGPDVGRLTSGYDMQGGQSRDFHEENARNRETREEANVAGHPGNPRASTQSKQDIESHAGQVGYGLSGGAHEDWGAFDRDQERQSPGYGQEEPWQQHPDDAARAQDQASAAAGSRQDDDSRNKRQGSTKKPK